MAAQLVAPDDADRGARLHVAAQRQVAARQLLVPRLRRRAQVLKRSQVTGLSARSRDSDPGHASGHVPRDTCVFSRSTLR